VRKFIIKTKIRFTGEKSKTPYINHRKYILSAAWKKKAQEKRDLVGNKCELCNLENNLQVHHLTYERLGKELMEDLQVLCGDCHMKVHGIKMVFKDGQWVKVIPCQKDHF
jgi:5-methylcytosine-specific restriction endonuclease McrA